MLANPLLTCFAPISTSAAIDTSCFDGLHMAAWPNVFPVPPGESTGWALHIHRVLLSLNNEVDAAFLGMDEGFREASAKCACQYRAERVFITLDGLVNAGLLCSQLLSPCTSLPLEVRNPCRRHLSSAAQPFSHSRAPVTNLQTHTVALARVAGLMDCLERMMTGAFPTAVPLPCAAIMMCAARILGMTEATPAFNGDAPLALPLVVAKGDCLSVRQ